MIVNICTLILVAVGTLICSVSLCLMTHCHTDFPQCTTRLIHTCVMIRIHSKYNPRQKSLEQNPSPPIQCCFFKTSRFAEKRPTLNGGGGGGGGGGCSVPIMPTELLPGTNFMFCSNTFGGDCITACTN